MLSTRPSRTVATAATLLSIAAAALVSHGPADAAADRPTASYDATERATPLAVTGYVLSGAPSTLVVREAHALHSVGVDGVAITADGTDVATPGRSSTRLLHVANRHDLRAELLVSNFSSTTDEFDPAAGAALLRSPANLDHVTARLAHIVTQQGWDGVTVDLESLTRADGPGLTAFVRQLRRKLAPVATISIDLMSSTTVDGFRQGGYQLAALGRVVDVVALMAYDLHGPTWSAPGPVGPLGWQRQATRALLTRVPARKVDLGVAGYGYTWPRTGTGTSETVAQARRKVRDDGAKAVWRPAAGEWTATLSNGTRMWWSDGRSYLQRVRLARSLGLHGLALWRLGSADPLP